MRPSVEECHLRHGESTRHPHSHNRAALSATVSSTGCISVGELAMTPKNFARRSLLLQRFLEFLEQPHVLDSDHGLVGEGFKELDLRRGEGAHLDATCVQRSNEFPLLTKGNGQEGAKAADDTQLWKIFCARTSGMWSVPCSRIQRNCGSSILISTRPMGIGPK